jgi:hypothetical protein
VSGDDVKDLEPEDPFFHREFVPEGRMTIAQQFTAGKTSNIIVLSPGGTIENGSTLRHRSAVPLGLSVLCLPPCPAVNCWAIVNHPSGINTQHKFLTTAARLITKW